MSESHGIQSRSGVKVDMGDYCIDVDDAITPHAPSGT